MLGQRVQDASSLISQLVNNRVQKTRDYKSARLVNKEVSALLKVSTPEDVCISGPFMPGLLATFLYHIELGKPVKMDCIFPDLYSTLGSARRQSPLYDITKECFLENVALKS